MRAECRGIWACLIKDWQVDCVSTFPKPHDTHLLMLLPKKLFTSRSEIFSKLIILSWKTACFTCSSSSGWRFPWLGSCLSVDQRKAFHSRAFHCEMWNIQLHGQQGVISGSFSTGTWVTFGGQITDEVRSRKRLVLKTAWFTIITVTG